LRKVRPTLFESFIENGDLPIVMLQPREQFVAEHVADQSEVMAAEPRQAARSEGRFVGRKEVLPCQQVSQLDFRTGPVLAQFGAASRQVAQLLIRLRRNGNNMGTRTDIDILGKV
jgi:hypothetical protein